MTDTNSILHVVLMEQVILAGIMPNKCTTLVTHSNLVQYTSRQRESVVYWICDDANNFQVNYLIDEIVSTGKGANSTISYAHHYLDNYSTGSKRLLIHADNCVGRFIYLRALLDLFQKFSNFLNFEK